MESMRSVIVVPSKEQVLKGKTHSSNVVIVTLRGVFPFHKVMLGRGYAVLV